MVEPASDTSDHQRFDEMFLHLTPRGATVPYNVCFDPNGDIWAATKGGLFKFHGSKKTTLWERKNMFPKKMAAFPQVICYKDKIVYMCGETQEKTTELRIFTLSGDMEHESFIDGMVTSMSISDEGDIFITKPPENNEATIFRAPIDSPLGWEDLASVEGEAFQAVCSLDDKTLVAAVASLPVNMGSRQRLVFIDTQSGFVGKSFSKSGKEDGEIFFPRNIHKYEGGFLIMDKSGRFLHYQRDGAFIKKLAEIDSYLGNGFCIREDAALMALSGIVLDQEQRTTCDDWLEWIKLDGSNWKSQREEKKKQTEAKK
ncbi:hypothetical protein WR25_16950 [Diploscapter pachys]|uniref:SMP-30/Gluconolactonase/LRE-like region domain-containing protein n=1 Tax=Diploscapter pachys TaxID=2018661 RepID=A0A2A2KQX2_9BILA|nr:hypothetical protein WR25_16950 [Diploscapter pachys]